MKITSAILLGGALLLLSTFLTLGQRSGGEEAPTPVHTQAAPQNGQPQTQAPMTQKEVISELKKQGADQLVKDLAQRGVDFEMDSDIEKSLRKAKATDQVVQAVTAAGPKERVAAAKAAALANGMTLVSPAENADFKALENELDPDKAVALAEDYVTKYPQSGVLTYVYAFEANAYEMKGDAENIVVNAEKSLALKKDNLMSLMMAAFAIPQPQYVNKHSADEERDLTRAETYVQEAYQAIDAVKKLPNEQDADFAKRKAGYISNVHADMGMIHLDRAALGLMGLDKDELAKAEAEYKLAVSSTEAPDPTDYFRLGEACRLEGKLDDSIAAFTKASELGQGVVKQAAEQQIARLKAAKAAAPAKP